MIQKEKFVAALDSSTTVTEMVTKLVEARGYTYGDIITSVHQPADPGSIVFPTGMPYHLGFNAAQDDWPVYFLTGHFTIDNVTKTYLVFNIGYNYTVSTALNADIAVAADDPLIGTGTARTIAKGAALAELLGYDDYMAVYHTDVIDGAAGEFPSLQWNPVYGENPLDPPVTGPSGYFVLEAEIASDAPVLINPHLFDPHEGRYTWTPPSGSDKLIGFRDQWNGSTLTERLWFMPLQQYTTDTENMTDLAMLRVTASVADLKAHDTAIEQGVAVALATLDRTEAAILALQGAFELTSVFGSKVSDVVDHALHVREATSYIPRP